MAGMTSALIGAGVSAVASGLGAGIGARKRKKAEREQRRILDGMNRDNEGDFLRDYYRDAFDDPSARSYLKRITEEFEKRNEGIENSGVATGATHEGVLAQKQAANEVLSDAVNSVVVNHEAQKDAAKERYLERKDAIASGRLDVARGSGEAEARMWTQLGSGLGDSLGGLASSYLGSGGKAKLLVSNPDLDKAGLKRIRDSVTPKLAGEPLKVLTD